MAYETHRVLVVDAGLSDVEGLSNLLCDFGCRRVPADGLAAAVESDDRPDAIVLALGPMDEAQTVLEELRARRTSIATLAVLAEDASSDAQLMAMECADDFVFWPARRLEIHQRVRRLVRAPFDEHGAASARLTRELGLRNLIGDDPAFRRMVGLIPRIAASDAPVLITGETGTGKELVARAVHHLSARRRCPFVAVNCSAVPDNLFENELFGHARGAYTDARSEQKGLARLAHGGVLFLDEIDGLSVPAQSKLLRFLEDGAYKPLGAEHFVQSDVRIMAATHEDLEALTRNQRFRSDLFFRLSILPVRLIPLRERSGDILTLANHFLSVLNTRSGGQPKYLTSGTKQSLAGHAWPGNVRELRNVIERAAALSDGAAITEDVLLLDGLTRKSAAQALTFREAKAHALSSFERAFLERALERHAGNITQAAREAHQDRRALGRLLKKHGLGRQSM